MFKYSVIIPAYENEIYLKRALTSIANQNFYNLEIIVSDDCSKNSNLKKVCEEFKKNNLNLKLDYYYQEKNLTPTPNTKFLLEKASGEFIILLPHDDYLVDINFLSECNEISLMDKEITCFMANTIFENTKKKMVNNDFNEWKIIKDRESFIMEFSNTRNHPAYSAVIFKKDILLKHNYFELFFSLKDYKKFKYEPDEIMMAPIFCIYYGKAVISGKVVSVRGIDGKNYSRSEFWEKTYRISVAMPLMKLYFHFLKKNKKLSNHFLKSAVFKYCFVPLNLQTLVHFKKINLIFVMIFSNIYFKIKNIKGVNYILKKLFDIEYLLKKK